MKQLLVCTSITIASLTMACSDNEQSTPEESGGSPTQPRGGSANGDTRSSTAVGTSAGSGGISGTVSTGGMGGASGGTGTSSTSNGRRHCKRGVAYGQHSDADLTTLSPKIVWWHNWHYAPDSKLASGTYEKLDVAYVPMVWGPEVDLSDVKSKIPATATTLLGYNEPNFYAQANVSASDTGKQWRAIQAIADEKGLRLVSPAVNYCGGGCHDTDPFSYLKAFFRSCPDCRVDVIAVHIYVGCQLTNGNHAQWLIDQLKRYQAEFTQPIWLTEFACNDARNIAEQKAFLEDAVTYLENTPRIERYAWFSGRADNVPYVNLLGESGKLTELGQAYVNAKTNIDCQP